MRVLTILMSIGLMLTTTACFAQQKGGGMSIQDGKEVTIEYTLKVDGQVVDTSENRAPLTYVHGQGQIIPGLSKALEGLKAGDKKSVTVSPEEGYGEVNPKAFQEVPRAKLASDIEPQVGMNLEANMPDGKKQIMRITEVKDETIVVDMNHPLAGKTLDFDVEVVSVK